MCKLLMILMVSHCFISSDTTEDRARLDNTNIAHSALSGEPLEWQLAALLVARLTGRISAAGRVTARTARAAGT